MKEKLNKRQREYCRCYTDRTSHTFGKIFHSVVEAGFSKSGASKTGSRLMRDPLIQAEIKRIEQEEAKGFNLSREDCIAEARLNFEKAVSFSERKYWNDIFLNLKGFNVIRSEVNQSIQVEDLSKQAEQAVDQARQRFN